MRTFSLLTWFAVGCWLPVVLVEAARAQDVVVVVNEANPVAELSIKELRQIYRGRRTNWDHGDAIRLIIPPTGDPGLEFLAEQVFRVAGPTEIYTYYLTAVFQQRIAESPPQLAVRVAMALVRFDPGAIVVLGRPEQPLPKGIKLLDVPAVPAGPRAEGAP